MGLIVQAQGLGNVSMYVGEYDSACLHVSSGFRIVTSRNLSSILVLMYTVYNILNIV